MNEKQIEDAFETPWPVQILAGFVLMVVHQAIIIPIAVFYSQIVAAVFAFVLGLLFMVGGSMYFGGGVIFAGILAIATSCAGGSFFYEYHQAATAEIVRNISVEVVHDFREKKCWDFCDGKPLVELSGTYVKKTRSKDGATSTSYFHAWPIVSDTWTVDDKVGVWAVGGGRSPSHVTTKAAYGFAINPLYEGEYKRAVADAQEKHGISSFDAPVLLEWVESYDAEVLERWNMAFYFLIFMNGLWFVGMTFLWIYSSFSDE